MEHSQLAKAAEALLQYCEKREATNDKKNLLADNAETGLDREPVLLIVGLKKFAAEQKVLKPVLISIPNALYNAEETSVCLFSRDPQKKYKQALLNSTPLTRIIGVEKLRGKFKPFEAKRALFNEYDLFVADEQIIKTLPKLLGKTFYKRTKIPMGIDIAEDKDGNISSEAVKAALDNVLASTYYQLSAGTTISIKVGHTDFSSKQISENVEAVVKALSNDLEGGFDLVKSLGVKTPSSPCLPFYAAESFYTEDDVVEEEEEVVKRKRVDPEEERQELEGLLADVVDEDGIEELRSLYKTNKKTKGEAVEAS